MGHHVGPSNTAHLQRMSDPNRGPWLTLNAASAAKYRAACKALGVAGIAGMNKVALRNALLTFPQADVKRALGWRETNAPTDAEREAAHDRLRAAGLL